MSRFPPVLILAGGLGTRVKALTRDLPKSLIPINGQPFVSYQLRLLADRGVRDVVLCVGYGNEPLRQYVEDGSKFGLNVQYCYDGDQLLGTGGAVQKAAGMVGSPFAMIYGDSYLDVDFDPIYRTFIQSGKKALMTVYRNENQLIPSNLLFENGLIVAYEKKQPLPTMKHCDFGLSFFHCGAFAGTQPPFDLSIVIEKLIAEKQLAGFESAQRFFEVGSEQGVQDLEHHLNQAAGKHN
jgi:N-acetyl-alpha-D-muramate 1-phosphate uridylyltransferase